MDTKENIPFFMDFAFELPKGMEIESHCQTRDCVTWGAAPCDDD